MPKRVLGLDLGSSSVGWAVAEFGGEKSRIVDMGSRIVPMTPDDQTQFEKGQAITKNAARTFKRTARKGYDRYQLRREKLERELKSKGIYAINIIKPIDLWALRCKAVTEKISLNELGRVLFHINQKRGYRSGKEDFSDDTKSKYVQSVNANYQFLIDNNMTFGQYVYAELLKDGSFRVKDTVYPRIAYIREFDSILKCQKSFYPDVLTDDFIKVLRDETIFYQRKLKSCKQLVSICDFEKRDYVKADGSIIHTGPHVAPKSSPLSQICRIWEFVNTITVKDIRYGGNFEISVEQKRQIADFLQTNEKLKLSELQKILRINKKDYWIDKSVFQRKLGNTTLMKLYKALDGKYLDLLKFHLDLDECSDVETGEIRHIVSENFKTEPLFQLWHTLYSIEDEEELVKALKKKFGIEDESVVSALCRIDFVKDAYSGKSSTAMRKILPYLMQGFVYSDACAKAGYNHSNYITKEDNEVRELSARIDMVKKGELRQPIVEKILNQTINVVNALNDRYGPFDEIRVELSRALKQSREEREQAAKNMSRNERENQKCAEKIAEYGFEPTRNRILKMKIWDETEHLCIYCGQPVNVREFLSGIDVEKEHIIPRSLLFDNSISNVTCSCRKCNQEKGGRTAFDYMKSKGDSLFEDYKNRVNGLYEKHKIGKAKRSKLLMSEQEIPSDFIDRQLRETQYVSRKAMELLRNICRNVYATGGSVTDFLRHIWGWDNVLHDLHFNQYKKAGLTEQKEIARNGNVKEIEVISGWSKRMDHRHHAIDALTIACTSQSIIQQFNTLNTLKDVLFQTYEVQGMDFKDKYSKVEKYALSQPHFSYAEVRDAVERIIVSIKSGKKVATPGKRYTYQGGKRIFRQNVLVPRGALSEETVYGRIKFGNNDAIVVKCPIASIDLKKAEDIVDSKIKSIVIEYLKAHGGKITGDVLDHQGNTIRSVRIFTGLDAVAPVRFNVAGEPVGFVKPGNNHHVAIYKDKTGKYQESVVTFWHAVERKKYGLPVIIEHPAEVFDSIEKELPETFMAKLPSPDWEFVISLQQNEMFVLGMDEDSYNDALKYDNVPDLSGHLYRVQKIASKNYVFRHHLETTVDDKIGGIKNEKLSMNMGKFKRCQSFDALFALNPHKIRIDNLGKICND